MQKKGYKQAYKEILEAINYSKTNKIVREWFWRHKFDPTNEMDKQNYIHRVLNGDIKRGNPNWL